MLSSRDMQLLNEAVAYRQVVKFGYSGASDHFSMRQVEPTEIKNGMLWGWDRDREATRSFKLDKMQGLIMTSQTFEERHF